MRPAGTCGRCRQESSTPERPRPHARHASSLRRPASPPVILEPVGSIVTCPGFCDEVIHLFVATGLRQVTANLGADEVIESITPIPLHDTLAMIRRGEIRDAKTIAALVQVDFATTISCGARRRARLRHRAPETRFAHRRAAARRRLLRPSPRVRASRARRHRSMIASVRWPSSHRTTTSACVMPRPPARAARYRSRWYRRPSHTSTKEGWGSCVDCPLTLRDPVARSTGDPERPRHRSRPRAW